MLTCAVEIQHLFWDRGSMNDSSNGDIENTFNLKFPFVAEISNIYKIKRKLFYFFKKKLNN